MRATPAVMREMEVRRRWGSGRARWWAPRWPGSTVTVTANATGGAGGTIQSGSGAAGDGAAVAMTDKVDGSTSGVLTLHQNVTAAAVARCRVVSMARQWLQFTDQGCERGCDQAEPFDVNTNGIGGSGGSRTAATVRRRPVPWASISTAINNGGWAEANTDARGGVGGYGSGAPVAVPVEIRFSVATASTAGDGNRVDVTGLAGYYGSAGNGGYVTGGVAGQSVGGSGGDATSTSTGTGERQQPGLCIRLCLWR